MMDGVKNSRFFVLYLTQCIFSRPFCKKEIRMVSVVDDFPILAHVLPHKQPGGPGDSSTGGSRLSCTLW